MRKKGFTLIELLVVVSIIGLLASIVVVSLGGARTQGRDAKRQADIRQIQTAQELCLNDRACDNAAANDYFNAGWVAVAGAGDGCAGIAAPMVGQYLNQPPVDPTNTGTFVYKCLANDTNFCISAQLEQPPVPATPYIHVRTTGLFPNQGAHCPTALGI